MPENIDDAPTSGEERARFRTEETRLVEKNGGTRDKKKAENKDGRASSESGTGRVRQCGR